MVNLQFSQCSLPVSPGVALLNVGALKGALSRLIPRRRRRSISSTGSSEAEVPPQYADLPIFDASELRATAVRSEVNGTMAYRDTERILGRSEHERQSYSYPSPIQLHLSTFRRCYITAEAYAPASIVGQFV
ncbi:hypothetical protein R3P38DRAFT_2810536 [Favolaschia claudopus]|uniref:Uncharacterized protein n=1 Tax=Favolaschia claudopus TaxID=2862362 RepID=A0AAV9ZBH2_9AGAR